MFLFAEGGGEHTPLIVEYINHLFGEPVLRFEKAVSEPAWNWLFGKLGVHTTAEKYSDHTRRKTRFRGTR